MTNATAPPTLFAALDVTAGQIIGTCMPRHRHQEWIKFLKPIDAQTPPDMERPLIVDNYSTHQHDHVKSWLRRHPRVHFHFIPTSSSWLNRVERWFRDIPDQRIRRGTFRKVPPLLHGIMDYIQEDHRSPGPFVWTAKADAILAKIRRARQVLDKMQSE